MKKLISILVSVSIIISTLPLVDSYAATDIPYYNWKQTNSQWSNYTFGSGNRTMAAKGCAITSVAMLVVHAGFRNESNFDPGELCSWLDTHNGFSGNNIIWGKVSEMIPGFVYEKGVSLSGTAQEKFNTIKNYYEQGYHIVVGVKSKGHWVAVNHVTNTNVVMMDPNKTNTDLFSTYPDSGIVALRLYKGGSTSPTPIPDTYHPPVGCLDDYEARNGELWLYGWAADPDVPSQSITLHVYIEGESAKGFQTTTHRIDVPYDGKHGFDVSIPTSATGWKHITLYALDPQEQCHTIIKEFDVEFPQNSNSPIGVLDEYAVYEGGLRVRGWAADLDSPSSAITVKTYIGDELHEFQTTGHRIDLPYDGLHGFDESISTSKTGNQLVRIYLTNIGGGSDALLSEFTVNIPEPQNQEITFTVSCWVSCDDENQVSYVPEKFTLSDRVFLNYKITDSTGNIVNPKDFNIADYTVTEYIYYPDGSLIGSYSYTNSETNWISVNYDSSMPTGKYSGKVVFSGGLEGVIACDWKVCDVAPDITKQPSHVTITEGETATFSVEASGTNLSYKWYVADSIFDEGVEIGGISGTTSPTLSLENCAAAEDGQYFYCKISNYGNDPVYSQRALLTVNPDVETYTISYSANGGTGAPATQYKVEDEPLVLSSVVPVREWHTFMGWTPISGSHVAYLPGETYEADISLTFYAVWEEASVLGTSLPAASDGDIDVGGEKRYYKFTPSVSDTYIFESTLSSGDTKGYLYDESGALLKEDDNSGEGNNFSVSYNLTAGNTYYYAAKWYGSTTTGNIAVKLSKEPDPVQTYTVTYDYATNGGTSATKTSATVEAGENADLTVTASKIQLSLEYDKTAPWEFVGWNTDKDAQTGLSSYTVNKDTTLYAIYSKTITARFYSCGGPLQDTAADTIYNNETVGKIVLPGIYTYEDWTPKYWRAYKYDVLTGTTKTHDYYDRIIYEIAEDTDFYATYTRDITLSYSSEGGDSTPVQQTATQHLYSRDGKECITFTVADAPSRSGYTFDGWALGSVDGEKINPGKSIYLYDSNTLYATWTKNEAPATLYTVTYNYSQNGGTSATKTSATVEAGEKADLTPTAAKSGWEFAGWNTDANATEGLSEYEVSGNTTLYAIYKKTMTVKFYSANNSLQNTETVTIYNNEASASLSLPAPSAYTGWTISGWREDTTAAAVQHSSNAQVNISSDKTYYAVYYRILTLCYDANGGSTVPSNQTSIQYHNASGSKQNITFTLASAISKSDAEFAGWSKDSTTGTIYNAGDSISISDNTTMYAAWKESTDISGTCGDNLTWVLDETGTLTISGTGKMTDWTYSSAADWSAYSNSITNVVIESGVTSIGSYAFYKCKSLQNVSIPTGVTSIGSSAFEYCSSLKNINIPQTVTNICSAAFTFCDALQEVVIPEGVTTIGNSAFWGCDALQSVTIPASVTDIGSRAFSSCPKLLNIYVSADNKNYTSADGVLFDKSKTTLIKYPAGRNSATYEIPEGVINLEDAFYACSSLQNVTIPTSVTNIGDYAFGFCPNLQSASIHAGVVKIGNSAFYKCDLMESIIIASSKTKIGINAFYFCDNLKDVYYGGTQQEWNSFLSTTTGNDVLKNATIHFEWTQTDITVDFAQTNKKLYFDITVPGYSDEATVYAALYDNDNRIVSIAAEPFVTDDITSISLDKNTSAAYAKIFVWRSSLNAVTKCKKIQLN